MQHDAIAPLRVRTQRLWGPGFDTPQEVVHWLGALQAQEFPLAKWSIAQRTRAATLADIDKAFADGTIVRTHVLRPTWHFALAEDIRWLLQVTAPRVNALNAYYNKLQALDKKLFTKSNTLIATALEGGSHLTRRELAAALSRGGIRARGPRLAYIMMRAELDAIICSGAMRGKQHTYALLDERAPQTRALEREAALAEFTRRYFTSRGPATLNDFLRWSSLTAAQGREGLALVGKALESGVIGGKTYWRGPAPRMRAATKPAVALVQGYDEIIMSYSESRDESFRLGDAPFFNAVLLDGRLVGHWKPVPQRNSARIKTVLNRTLDREGKNALEAAIEAYGKFIGLTAARARGK